MNSIMTGSVAAPHRTETASAKHAKALRLWLASLALLIVVMILVGGATRLTESGLSITEWKPVTGVIPPLSETAWQDAFEAYQQIPQYTELNRGMSLDAFKTIYWWEWTHRFLGRLIGLVFLVPFIAFWIAGYIPRPLLPRLIGLFLLGGLQGAVGWYMVMSGLVDRTDVSQYRLMAHFGIAVVIFGYTLWLLLGLGAGLRTGEAARRLRAPVWVASAVLCLIFVQMLAGALVAGLDAGRGFTTWPLINGAFIPSGLGEATPWHLNLFENPLTVQFNHRMLGYAVVVSAVAQALWLAMRGAPAGLVGSALTLAVLSLLQATIGVWTLLLGVPIELGLAHQAGAVAVFAAAIYHLWLASHAPAQSRETHSQTVASA